MVTLLLTFFVLLLSFANTDTQKFKEMLGSLKDAFGTKFEDIGDFEQERSKAEIIESSPNILEMKEREKLLFFQEMKKLVKEGKIRSYGWSTDFPERAQVFAQGPKCSAVQLQLNVLDDNPGMIALCEKENLESRLPSNDERCGQYFCIQATGNDCNFTCPASNFLPI